MLRTCWEGRQETEAEAAGDTIIRPGAGLYSAAGEPPALFVLVCPDVVCAV